MFCCKINENITPCRVCVLLIWYCVGPGYALRAYVYGTYCTYIFYLFTCVCVWNLHGVVVSVFMYMIRYVCTYIRTYIYVYSLNNTTKWNGMVVERR